MARKVDMTQQAGTASKPSAPPRQRVRKETPLTSAQRVSLRDALLASLDAMNVPDAVRAMRLSLGKTQQEYASMAKITRRTLSLIETGQFNPSLQVLESLGRPFGFEVGFRVPLSRRAPPAAGGGT